VIKQFVVYSLFRKKSASGKKCVHFSICTIALGVLLELGGRKGRGAMRKDHISPDKAMIREHLQWDIICSESGVLPEDRICSHN
jgi:hypothetical protein